MVQEIAQEIIRSARKKGTQDIYFVPKLDAYELHMRVGGIVDFANRDYQEHQAAKWNEQIDQLLKDGHITSLQAETEKISYS